jgi:CheY-like chemotaxis protein
MHLRELESYRVFGRVFVVNGEFQAAETSDGSGKRVAILQSLPDGPARKTVRPRRVLVVEDNLDGVHSLVLLLRDMGHVVEYAINGHAALEMATRMRPEIVLLDLNLPGLTGFDVCKRIKASPALKAIRVVALTAYTQDEFRLRAKAAGCELHLIKPVHPHELETLLSAT